MPKTVKEDKPSHSLSVLATLVADDPILQGHPERMSWANDRWLKGIAFLRPRITRNGRFATGLRGPIVFGALLVPILATGSATNTKAPFWRWATLAISVVVALCTALDQVYRPASRWRVARSTRSGLEAEGWAYLQRAGKYDGLETDACFSAFFDAIEGLWRDYELVYQSQVAQQPNVSSSDSSQGGQK